MKKGFTLAEVLITLGVIGVVAALTTPALIQNYRKHAIEIKLKKVYSVMNQALKMSVAQNGDYEGWFIDCGTDGHYPTCTEQQAKEWLYTYLFPYLNYLKIEEIKNSRGQTGFRVYFTDGSILSISSYVYDMGFYPSEKVINQVQEASLRGDSYATFHFRVHPVAFRTSDYTYEQHHLNKGFEPYTFGPFWDGTMEGIKLAPTHGCNTNNTSPYYCTKLIQLNDWKIPDDFPFKLYY
ncbi:MAG: type II secretion system GspH family protein [Heliobacteriaceae bacterium]|jgi:prepilin-type N-terminal cleavage/methylation domain-containing protein|nr:type II secretion system GspH family protein [Heliobacteriaceae bacterium]